MIFTGFAMIKHSNAVITFDYPYRREKRTTARQKRRAQGAPPLPCRRASPISHFILSIGTKNAIVNKESEVFQ